MPHKLPFRVIHATSQEDYHKASEISNHTPTSKGWQSANFCLYPQDIVISLEHRCQIKKIQLLSHQYLIATKIEFFVGDCANNVQFSPHNAKFTRLGYVSLSDNEKTQFKARELKSVHVDAICRFVKLVVHTNFINKFNHYNQVGIIAVNLIGDELFSVNNDEIENFNALPQQDHISHTEDLAFDISVDPETAQIIRNLEKLKIQAVEEEQFDKASKIRDTVKYLQEVGEKLGKLEIEKKIASDNENYDRAKIKKQQIDQYRHRVYKELDALEFLNMPINLQKPINLPKFDKPIMEPELYSQRGYNQNNNALIAEEPKIYQNPEDRPLPALKNQPIEVLPSQRNDFRDQFPEKSFIASPEPAILMGDEIDSEEINALTKSDLSEASEAIEVYGLPLVSKVYSKNWTHQENALLEIEKRLTEMPNDTDKDDVKSEIRAAACLLKKAFKSRVTKVVHVACNVNKLILMELVERLGIVKPEIHYYLDKIIPEIFKCVEDNKAQIREITQNYLIEMSQWDHVKQFPTIFSEAIKPFSQNILVRPGQIKLELLLELYSIHRLTNHYFTLDNFMKYAVHALQHKSAELRESAETLIVVLYRNEDKQIVRSYLPPDDIKTRKNVLYKRLFEKLDKIDGIDNFANKYNKTNDQESARPKELENIQVEQKPKESVKPKPVKQINKKPIIQPNVQKEPQSSRISQQKPSQQIPTTAQAHAPTNLPKLELQDDPTLDWNTTCIFCGERNESLKDNMDLHYWKNCPILRRCPYCKQAVEISSLTQHFLQECEQESQFGQCPRCTEAILKTELDQHISDALCNPADQKNSIRCPLCHENIPLGQFVDSPEALWQYHLMDETNGCPQNPRRLVAIQRQHQQNEMNNKNNNIGARQNNNNRKSQLPRAKGK